MINIRDAQQAQCYPMKDDRPTYAQAHTYCMACVSSLFLSRTAWGNDLCPVHQRHGYLRPSDDVHHHLAGSLLHCVGLRRRHHPDAFLPAHKVWPCPSAEVEVKTGSKFCSPIIQIDPGMLSITGMFSARYILNTLL